MGKIIAITNQKGGVGKTTTAINLAAALAEMEKGVLLIDLDSQGNATSGLGIRRDNKNIYNVLTEECKLKDSVMQDIRKNLSFVASDMNLAGIEQEFSELEDKNEKLKKILKNEKKKYDFIIIDCPPSLGTLTVNALTAADSVIIPTQCEYFALEGLSQVLDSINIVKRSLNKKLKLEGILFTMYDGRNNLSQQVVDTVENNFNGRIFKTVIPRNVRLAECPSHGMTIIEYESSSSGAESYRMLANEICQ